jgi:N-acetylgalactosamine-6-sulfatase
MNALVPRGLAGLLVAAAVALASFAVGTGAARPGRTPGRPNVVVLLADDLGYGDLGCYGCRDIRTPNIDRLAAQGVRFTNFYANGPECTPTRAALLTGRYQQRVGGLECAIGVGNVGRYDDAIRLAKQNDLGLPPEEGALPRLLKRAGYATALCGKWHLGYEEKFAPDRHGFDHAFYCVGGGMDYFHHVEEVAGFPPVLRLDGRPVRRQGYFTDLVAEDAVRFLRANRDRPFFLYVPFTAPHAPFQGPGDGRPDPLPADSPLWKQGKAPPAVYASMVERLDEAVGKVLGELDGLKLAANTLVVFMSDNGGTASARPTPFAGIKGSTFEGGIRVPCVVRWPGVLPARAVTDQVAITMDLSASIARAAGAGPPKGRPFDGIDVLGRLRQGQPLLRRTLFWRARRGDRTWWAVREGSLKYVARQDGGRRVEYLLDLAHDPGEKNNLLARSAEDAARLRRLLAEWEAEVRPRR